MQEIIILAPDLNSSETLKSLAMNGINTIGTKILDAPELSRYSLMKSGISVTEKILSQEDELILVAEAVRDEPYFGKASFADIRNIRTAIRTLRNLAAVEDEAAYITEVLSGGVFEEKNKALISVCSKYLSALKEKNSIDGVSVVRKAIDLSKQLDGDFICLEEYQLSPLEKQLLEKLSGGTYKSLKIAEIYNSDAKIPASVNVRNCYGSTNEVESIIDSIYRGKSLDTCVVAVTDTSAYSQLFFDYAVEKNIPVTFGCGVP